MDHPLSIRLKPRELGKVTLLHLYPRHTLLPMSALNRSLVPPSSVNTVIHVANPRDMLYQMTTEEVGQMIEDMKGKNLMESVTDETEPESE